MCSTALRKRREYFSSLLGRLCNRCGCSWYQFFMACVAHFGGQGGYRGLAPFTSRWPTEWPTPHKALRHGSPRCLASVRLHRASPMRPVPVPKRAGRARPLRLSHRPEKPSLPCDPCRECAALAFAQHGPDPRAPANGRPSRRAASVASVPALRNRCAMAAYPAPQG